MGDRDAFGKFGRPTGIQYFGDGITVAFAPIGAPGTVMFMEDLIACGAESFVGEESGFSSLGVVVGATYPEAMASVRQAAPEP